MIMNRNQLLATSFLAVLIVASVMAMPRASMDAPDPNRRAVRASGMVTTSAPSVSHELSAEQVKDLTYN